LIKDDENKENMSSEINLLSTLGTLGNGNQSMNSTRRMKQTLQMSKRIIELQKESNELARKLEDEKLRNNQISEEVTNLCFYILFMMLQLKSSNDILEKTQQPYNYLIGNLREKDKVVSKNQQIIVDLENEIR
jgi:hypothetical protein